jgi:hypothetical protein
VSTEALLLALTTIVRPTTIAAVFAILATRTPQRLLVAYVVVGAAFSLAVGALVVFVVTGLAAATASTAPRPLLDLVLGGAALGYACATAAGWAPRRRRSAESTPPEGPNRLRRRLDAMTVRGAALAGILTHLPGLVYLAALSAIVGSADRPVDAVVQVLVYNVIWFSLPLTVLVVSLRRPERCREILEALGSLTHRHKRLITVVFLGVFGAYLVWTGLAALLA